MSRLDPIPHAEMTAAQAAAQAEVVSGPRGKAPAPMIAWLRNPELARRGQKLGELLRFEISLEPHLTELAILVCGRHWTSHHEWGAHKRLALAAGLDPQTIADIAARVPPYLRDDRERIVFEAAAALLSTGRLPQPLYDRGVAILGETALVELVATLGYYCLVALTLNAFELGLPDAFAPELGDEAMGA